jgi:hypothetical protein
MRKPEPSAMPDDQRETFRAAIDADTAGMRARLISFLRNPNAIPAK